jgi:hypothetical protein
MCRGGKEPNKYRQPKRLMGRFTKRGFFVFDRTKVPRYLPPDLDGFKLLPYVSHKVEKLPEEEHPYITLKEQNTQ